MFDDIDHSDIASLINNKITERQNLEYKEKAWEHNDIHTREMLRDISSMANAYGGYIILGIQENQGGIPVEITGITDAEKERDRIWTVCISCIEPRIPGLKIKTISEPKQKSLIIIFIPRSTRSPHMITLKGLNQFWIRHDRQKSPMSIEEIREACIKVENLKKNVQDFIEERKAKILEAIRDRITLVIGTLPLTVKNTIVDTSDESLRAFLKNPPEQRRHGFNLEFLDAYDCPLNPTPILYGLKIGNIQYKKTELMRNGYFELVVRLDSERFLRKVFNKELYVLNHLPIVEYTVSYFRALKNLTQLLGIEETIVSFLIINNIRNFGLTLHMHDIAAPEIRDVHKYEQPHLELEPEEIFTLQYPDKIAKVFLEKIWNAFEFESRNIPYFKKDQFKAPS